MSTHNICFLWRNKKKYFVDTILSGDMTFILSAQQTETDY